MKQLCDGLFSKRKSTEHMMRGSTTEDIVQKALCELPYVKKIFDVGLITCSERSGFACSPDVIDLLHMTKLEIASDMVSNNSVTDDNGNNYAMSTLEIEQDFPMQM